MLYTLLVLYLDVVAFCNTNEYDLKGLVDLASKPSTLCERGGKRQSPIDLTANDTVKDFEREFIKHGQLKFHGYRAVLMTGVNDGKNIKYVTDGDVGMRPRVTGGPLALNYYLLEVAFKFLSEHALEGVKYPLEIQLVHLREDLNLTTAKHYKDGYAIFSVFANVSKPANITHRHPTDQIHDYLPELTKKGKLSGLIIDLSDILVPTNDTYYTYMGSLTVPACNEVVVWVVFKKPINVTYESYSILTQKGRKRHNYRPLNELRRHLIYTPHEPFFSTPTAVRNIVTAVTNMMGFLKEVSNVVDLGMNEPE